MLLLVAGERYLRSAWVRSNRSLWRFAYAVGHSLNALRKLGNRVSHQEQILYVDHAARLGEIYGLTHAMAPQSLGMMKRLDRVQRTLALKPQY